ncbi:MAG: helix-turn-helix domain-containing protein, partial [Enterobacterales bacterium]|nr:helix-turn-helix domain-containing protein [Enterobacterales bacterium]
SHRALSEHKTLSIIWSHYPEWDETLRSKIGVMNHIQQSTRISRSVVAEVLAALRQGNYINMSRGKLVSINRLPTEY